MSSKTRAKKSQQPPVERKDLNKAIEHFLNKGGQIKVLPPQQIIERSPVGGDHIGSYERPENLAMRLR